MTAGAGVGTGTGSVVSGETGTGTGTGPSKEVKRLGLNPLRFLDPKTSDTPTKTIYSHAASLFHSCQGVTLTRVGLELNIPCFNYISQVRNRSDITIKLPVKTTTI